MEILALWPVEQHAVRINQDQFGAVAEESDGRALGDFDTQMIRQDALDAGILHPGELLDLRAAGIERNSQDAAVTVVGEKLLNLIARHDVVVGNFNLIRLKQ